ncbi:hypothetical protein [Umezawaea sp. Da 62-37]|uniref:hypothetical protein n=1 Tax=Umezawaea sp. Da 62-37 TaxID=3075927 RepID=UPI0028F72636|nr:hypothetical protein [Umezawaea sp. Da 62-37]WNV82784.1 hypothetical protein RM788_31895 [Umezawaea sp. Da 62-37]
MPEPVLLSIATAVVTKAVTGLYQLVKSKFADDPQATAVFEAAEAAGPGSPEVVELGETLERAERADPEFGRRLRGEWEKTSVSQTGHITNQISGTVHGKVLQAGDIQGGVTF